MGALLGPLLTVLLAIFRGIFKFFGAYLLKDLGRVFRYASVIIIYVSLTSILIISFTQLTSSLKFPMPEMIRQSWGCLMPSNFVPCLMAILSARILLFFYKVKYAIITYTLLNIGKSDFSGLLRKFIKGKKGLK